MSVKVSVIVPVFNPGRHIDDLITSVLEQSLPRDEYEVIFVDDGSTDGTGQRLDALAAEHAHITSLHIPNSGWPGRPRNVGIEAARGTYVYFVDNDDYLGSEALERLHDYAERHGSDVVVGKVVGRGRTIPREIFRKNVERSSLAGGFPLTLLTPHKLFRRSLLMEHGLRYPEGRRRLEDHLFVMAVYFRAEVLSILADYACYYWVKRDDTTNASSSRFDPRGYYDNLREVLDLVAANTAPGAYRDSLMRHWYRGKVLGRMGGRTLFSYPPDYRAELHAELQRLVREDRWGEGVAAGLPMTLRVRSRLLREAGLADLERLAEVERAMVLDVQLQSATALSDGRLRFRLTSRPRYADGSQLRFRRVDGRVHWELPAELADLAVLTTQDRDVTKALSRAKVTGIARSTEDKREFLLPATSTTSEAPDGDLVSLLVVSDITVDPRTAAAGAPLAEGEWNLVVRLGVCGWDLFSPVLAAQDPAPDLPGVVVGEPPVAVVARWATKARRLRLRVDPSGRLPDGVVAAPTTATLPDPRRAPTPGLARELGGAATGQLRVLLGRSPQLRRVAWTLRELQRRRRG